MTRSQSILTALSAGFVMALSLVSTPAAATAATAQPPAAQPEEIQPMKQAIPLSVYRVKRNMGADGVYLLDCNPQDMFEKSHIPGAINVNVVDWLKLLPKDKKNSYLIFYCVNRMCNVSQETAEAALKAGYYNVYNMPDGIQGWVQNGFEFEGTARIDPELKKLGKRTH